MKLEREHARNPTAPGAVRTAASADGGIGALRVSASLGLAMAVMAAMACQTPDLTGPAFDDDGRNRVELTGTQPSPATDSGGGAGEGANGKNGEKW